MRLLAAAFVAVAPLLWTAPASGQEMMDDGDQPTAGTVELGLFGQYTRFDFDREASCACAWPKNGVGFGGRVAVFLDRHFFLEADGATTVTERAIEVGGKDVRYSTLAARINYNQPLFPEWDSDVSILAGIGPVHTWYNSFENSGRWGGSGILGARWGATDWLTVRVDGFADYMPEGRNFNSGLRAGLSVRIPRQVEERVVTVRDTVVEERVVSDTVVVEGPMRERTMDASVLEAPVFFDFDQANIRPDARAAIETKLPWLRANPNVRLSLEGHADERGTSEYNAALALRRSESVRAYLIRQGISVDRLDVTSLGDTAPICTQEPASDECHQINRRVNFIVLSMDSEGLHIPERR